MKLFRTEHSKQAKSKTRLGSAKTGHLALGPQSGSAVGAEWSVSHTPAQHGAESD